MIAIGMLDRRITLQYPDVERDTTYGGGKGTTWTDDNDVWAHVVWEEGKELFEGEQHVGQDKVLFYIRWRKYASGRNIDTTWRIEFDHNSETKYYYIESVQEMDGRQKFMLLRTIEKTSE